MSQWHYNTFESVWRGGGALGEAASLITFRVDGTGRVASLVADAQGDFEFTRVGKP